TNTDTAIPTFTATDTATATATPTFTLTNTPTDTPNPTNTNTPTATTTPSNTPTQTPVASGLIVLSQVYGGGGATSGTPTYKFDYAEVFNRGTTSVDVSGWSIQYGAATGNFGSSGSNIFTFANGTVLSSGQYYLVQLGSAGTVGGNFPVTADATGTLNLSAASGKLALANTNAALGCGATASPCSLPDSRIIDLVSY